MKNRVFQYDFIRAVAIVVVVISHVFTSFASTINEISIAEYINTMIRFSAAQFFFLAGLFFNINGDLAYLKHKLLRVLIPYSLISIPAIAFQFYKYQWSLANTPEAIYSFLLGQDFGYYFIFVIVELYLIGYVIGKFGLTKNLNLLLLGGLAVQSLWMIYDEPIYRTYHFYSLHFHQFRLNDLFFYRIPFAWIAFFVLGIWYQSPRSQQIVSTNKMPISLALLASFVIYNLMMYFNSYDYTPHGSLIWLAFSLLVILTLLGVNADKLKKWRWITYLSKNAYTLYLTHFFFLYFLQEIEKRAKLDFPYGLTLIFFPAIILASILTVELLKKVFGKHSVTMIGS